MPYERAQQAASQKSPDFFGPYSFFCRKFPTTLVGEQTDKRHGTKFAA